MTLNGMQNDVGMFENTYFYLERIQTSIGSQESILSLPPSLISVVNYL